VHEAGHGLGNGAERQGVQAQQAAVAARGSHHREAGEAAEDRAGAQAQAEAPGLETPGRSRGREFPVFRAV